MYYSNELDADAESRQEKVCRDEEEKEVIE